MKKLFLGLWLAVSCGLSQGQTITAPQDFICSDLATYYPMGNDLVTLNVNFIFLEPSPGGGRYATLNSTHAQALVDSLNQYLSHIQPPSFVLPSPYTADYFTDTKIRLRLKSVNHDVNAAAYNHLSTFQYPYPDTNAINFVYGVDTTCCGQGVTGGNRIFYYINSTVPCTSIAQTGDARLMFHELGHVLGLWHTNLSPPSLSNPNGMVISMSNEVNDYWLEDTSQYNHCGLNKPNNVMGYNCERCYLSPKQMGMMHRTIKYGTPHRAIYSVTNSPGGCAYSPGIPATLYATGTTTITTDPQWQGDVIVQAGAHLIISTCVRLGENRRIIVEPKGKLSVINGRITSGPCGQWKGIEVLNNNGMQAIDPVTGMPLYVGMVELMNATISNAEIGVFLGERSTNGQPTNNGGGGIIFSKNSNYINNTVAVQFAPYYVSPAGAPGNFDNMSYFKCDTFMVNRYYDAPHPHVAAIKLNKVKDVDIFGCYFEDVIKCGSKGIYAIESSVKMKDYCTGMTGTTCTGTLIQNRFHGFEYSIFSLSSAMFNFPSLIDHVSFDQDNAFTGPGSIYYENNAFHFAPRHSRGAIYMVNNTGTQIVNCTFNTSYYESVNNNIMPYAVYLDNCPLFTVENNLFYGDGNTLAQSYRRGGMFINNSGPNVNNIYNNEFTNYTQAIWAQNLNYDTLNGGGLLMRCNDINYNRYGIGVQNQFTGPNCMGCPTPTQWAGISPVQGINSSVLDDLVRNNYQNPIGCATGYAENKFYINTTDNAFAVTSHASFVNNFQPHSQTNSCGSNVLELTIVNAGNPPSIVKSSYCSPNNLPTFSNLVLNQNASDLRNLIKTLKYSYSFMDGGTTDILLAMVNDPTIDNDELREAMISPDFLSDKVLIAYFTRENTLSNDIKDVFTKNAPVNPLVWAKIVAMGWNSEDPESFDSVQFSGNISAKNQIEFQLTHAYNSLGLINNEKISRFLNDSTGPNYDSILVMYKRTEEFPWGGYKQVDVLIAANRYDEAYEAMSNLPGPDAENIHFSTLHDYMIQLKSGQVPEEDLQRDTVVFDYLKSVAASNNALLEGYAKGLLADVYDYPYQEVIYSPEESGTRVAANTGEQDEKKPNVIENMVLYPNPASTQLNIEFDQEIPGMRLQIVGLSGVSLINTHFTNHAQVDISVLQEGVYFVNVYHESELVGVKKLVVMR